MQKSLKYIYFNRNPTTRTFRTSFRFQVTHNLMKSTDLSNCETDYDYNLFDPSLQNMNSTITSNIPINSVDFDSFISNSSEDSNIEYNDYNEQKITLEYCSNTYFAGYLAKKCIDQFKCPKCELIILKTKDFFFNDPEY